MVLAVSLFGILGGSLLFITLPWNVHGGKVLTETQSYFVPPSTVESLNTSRYLGRWYQVYSSLIPNITFEKNLVCVVADYYPTDKDGAAFGLTNSATRGSPTGDATEARGTAYSTKDKGKFKIEFEETTGVKGDYWVTNVGSAPNNEPYPWAVVSTPFLTTLFILARDVQQFRSQYEDLVLERVRNQGFSFPFNRPRETFQSPECRYPPEPGSPPAPAPISSPTSEPEPAPSAKPEPNPKPDPESSRGSNPKIEPAPSHDPVPKEKPKPKPNPRLKAN